MSGAVLRVRADVLRALLDHARAEAPNEACGLLSGVGGVAARYHPARNALDSPTAFDLHPQDLVRIMFAIEAAGEELAGIVHSHPRSPAVPSGTDVRSAAYRVPHLIVSLGDGRPAYRAWDLAAPDGGEVRVEVLGVPGSASGTGDVDDLPPGEVDRHVD